GGQDHVRVKFDKVRGCGANEVHVVASPALIELDVYTGRPTTFTQFLAKGPHTRLHFGVCGRVRHQNPDPPHALALLRPSRDRPRGRAPEQRNELAPAHSITSSARARIPGGNVIPSALAVLRLTASSNLTGCSTGRSAGLVPCKILCT